MSAPFLAAWLAAALQLGTGAPADASVEPDGGAAVGLQVMDDPEVRRDLAAAAAGPGAGSESSSLLEQTRGLVDYLQQVLVDPLANLLGVPDARMRASLITASLGGMVGVRYVLRIEPLASASTDDVVAMFAPSIQRLLDPTIPLR